MGKCDGIDIAVAVAIHHHCRALKLLWMEVNATLLRRHAIATTALSLSALMLN